MFGGGIDDLRSFGAFGESLHISGKQALGVER